MSNDLYLLEESPSFGAEKVYEGSYTGLDSDKFTSAVSLNDDGKVIFFGPDGILEHDVRRRNFRDIPKGISLRFYFQKKFIFCAMAAVSLSLKIIQRGRKLNAWKQMT